LSATACGAALRSRGAAITLRDAVVAVGLYCVVFAALSAMFACLRGTTGDNRFGPDPLQVRGMA
jgi:uncharacterized membrane protein YhaH (DUF805 family)